MKAEKNVYTFLRRPRDKIDRKDFNCIVFVSNRGTGLLSAQGLKYTALKDPRECCHDNTTRQTCCHHGAGSYP